MYALNFYVASSKPFGDAHRFFSKFIQQWGSWGKSLKTTLTSRGTDFLCDPMGPFGCFIDLDF